MAIIDIKNITICASAMVVTCLYGCSDQMPEVSVTVPEVDESAIIQIGGIETNAMSVTHESIAQTRASEAEPQDAETIDWLLSPLFGGLDVTYYPSSNTNDKRVAILKLEKTDPNGGDTSENIKKSNGNVAEYSFYYKGTTNNAIWKDNGYHYFEGVYVPAEIRYKPSDSKSLSDITATNGTAPNLDYDQSEEQTAKTSGTTNYTLLERYLGMPANTRIAATVGRIKLPFKHRLSRVMAYVLIDPTLDGIKIDGYMKDAQGNTVTTEDATTSAIRFCNVKVLNGVEESASGGTDKLTPKWTKARKAIPHFVEERGSLNSKKEVMDANDFIMYYKKNEKEYIFPANDSKWTTARDAWNTKYNDKFNSSTETDESKKKNEAIRYADEHSDYERTVYGKVPLYDIIVRPTYTSTNNVMYDEDMTGDNTIAKYYNEENVIDFEITLDNGLHYTKEFKFDLDANYQTIVYLRIKQESIDYNSSGSEVWDEKTGIDGYYGVNNQNGNTLSYAGNSWQRAYRIGTKHDAVTDGHFYDKDDEDKYAQYVDKNTWIEMFAKATENGTHHGDYFILDNDIHIPASSLPDNFEFTGHLDGLGHTITVDGAGQPWEEFIAATYQDYENSDVVLYTEQNKSSVFTMPEQLYTKTHHDAVLYKLPEDAELLEQIEDKYYLKSTLSHIEATPAVLYANVEEYNEAKGRTLTEGLTSEAFEQLSDEIKGSYTNVEDYNNAKVKLTTEQFEALTDEQKTKTPAVEEHYEVTADSKVIVPGETIKVDAYDTYALADPQPTRQQLLSSPDGTYYKMVSYDNYLPYTKPEHLYTEHDHTYNSYLFKGLKGTYDTPQETNMSATWLANVHKEGDKWVPVKGYRAELLNVKLADGCTFFPNGAIFTYGDLTKPDATVSGYIFNCWEGSKKIVNEVPIPKY